MGRSRRGLGLRPFFLFVLAFLALMLLVSHAAAQDDDTITLPNLTDTPDDDARTTDAPDRTQATPTDNDDASTTAERTPDPTETEEPTVGTESLPGLTTETPDATPTDDPTETESIDMPDITLPTLPGAKIPPPAVPPKEGAPYLQESDYPEGTVFIAVGAVLGFFALAVVAWRGLVAWSINRSVRRAAADQTQTDATALLNSKKRRGNNGKSGMYRQAPGSSMSMEKLGNPARHSAMPGRTHTPSASLFFSPTASGGMHNAGSRGSAYLPAGYYHTSSAALGNGPGLAHLSGSSIPLSPLGPQAQGYSRTKSMGTTPPGSPGLRPTSNDNDQSYPSTSTLNLTSPPQGRAPSAYLEDLFENHPPGR
ncbi:hypothetical protein VTO42DRAFT_6344 [Malbranchea cinnamomea]